MTVGISRKDQVRQPIASTKAESSVNQEGLNANGHSISANHESDDDDLSMSVSSGDEESVVVRLKTRASLHSSPAVKSSPAKLSATSEKFSVDEHSLMASTEPLSKSKMPAPAPHAIASVLRSQLQRKPIARRDEEGEESSLKRSSPSTDQNEAIHSSSPSTPAPKRAKTDEDSGIDENLIQDRTPSKSSSASSSGEAATDAESLLRFPTEESLDVELQRLFPDGDTDTCLILWSRASMHRNKGNHHYRTSKMIDFFMRKLDREIFVDQDNDERPKYLISPLNTKKITLQERIDGLKRLNAGIRAHQRIIRDKQLRRSSSSGASSLSLFGTGTNGGGALTSPAASGYSAKFQSNLNFNRATPTTTADLMTQCQTSLAKAAEGCSVILRGIFKTDAASGEKSVADVAAEIPVGGIQTWIKFLDYPDNGFVYRQANQLLPETGGVFNWQKVHEAEWELVDFKINESQRREWVTTLVPGSRVMVEDAGRWYIGQVIQQNIIVSATHLIQKGPVPSLIWEEMMITYTPSPVHVDLWDRERQRRIPNGKKDSYRLLNLHSYLTKRKNVELYAGQDVSGAAGLQSSNLHHQLKKLRCLSGVDLQRLRALNMRIRDLQRTIGREEEWSTLGTAEKRKIVEMVVSAAGSDALPTPEHLGPAELPDTSQGDINSNNSSDHVSHQEAQLLQLLQEEEEQEDDDASDDAALANLVGTNLWDFLHGATITSRKESLSERLLRFRITWVSTPFRQLSAIMARKEPNAGEFPLLVATGKGLNSGETPKHEEEISKVRCPISTLEEADLLLPFPPDLRDDVTLNDILNCPHRREFLVYAHQAGKECQKIISDLLEVAKSKAQQNSAMLLDIEKKLVNAEAGAAERMQLEADISMLKKKKSTLQSNVKKMETLIAAASEDSKKFLQQAASLEQDALDRCSSELEERTAKITQFPSREEMTALQKQVGQLQAEGEKRTTDASRLSTISEELKAFFLRIYRFLLDLSPFEPNITCEEVIDDGITAEAKGLQANNSALSEVESTAILNAPVTNDGSTEKVVKSAPSPVVGLDPLKSSGTTKITDDPPGLQATEAVLQLFSDASAQNVKKKTSVSSSAWIASPPSGIR